MPKNNRRDAARATLRELHGFRPDDPLLLAALAIFGAWFLTI